jgi:uncharacterized protein
MLYGYPYGELEIREVSGTGGVRLSGQFPYNRLATLSDGGTGGGRPRKERIASRAFAYRVNQPNEDIHLLAGHDYNRPLASRGTGTLDLTDSEQALSFEAELTPTILETHYGQDALRQLRSGLATGLSPGFRLPPPRAVSNPEVITQEPHNPSRGQHGAIIRTIVEALLYELSLVVVPAYKDASVTEEVRSWELSENGGVMIPGTLEKRILVKRRKLFL